MNSDPYVAVSTVFFIYLSKPLDRSLALKVKDTGHRSSGDKVVYEAGIGIWAVACPLIILPYLYHIELVPNHC